MGFNFLKSKHNKADLIFKKNIKKILKHGTWDENPRPKYEDGTPAHSIFITQIVEEYDISKGEFPITSLRPIPYKNSGKEILWIYQDQTSDLSVLRDKYGIKWWDSWDIGDDTIGQRYGATVSRYQLVQRLLKGLKEDKYGRRHIINLWQEKDFEDSEGLPPCAFQTMWSVRKGIDGEYYLDVTLTQRSSDYLVAGHVNMIQYVMLQLMVAHECGYKAGKFVRFTQNLHIYDRHIEQAKEILKRKPVKQSPKIILNAENKGFYDITIDDFELIDYHPVKPQLKFPLGI